MNRIRNRKRSAILCAACLLAVLAVGSAFVFLNMNRGPHWTELTGPTILSPDTGIGETASSLDYITLKLDKKRYSTKVRKITGKLQNKDGLYVEYSDVPTLQLLQDGIWYDLKRGGYVSTGILPVVDGWNTNRVGIDLNLYGETLIPGRYRMVISVRRPGLVGDTGDVVSAEFDVLE